MKFIFTFLKLVLICWIIGYGLSCYDSDNGLFKQFIVVWVLIIIPCAMGYESLISIVLKSFLESYIKTESEPKKAKESFKEKLQKKIDENNPKT